MELNSIFWCKPVHSLSTPSSLDESPEKISWKEWTESIKLVNRVMMACYYCQANYQMNQPDPCPSQTQKEEDIAKTMQKDKASVGWNQMD